VKALALATLGLSLLPGSCFGSGRGDPMQEAVDRLVMRFDVPACADAVPLRGAGRRVPDEQGETRGTAVTWSYQADEGCLAALETELGGWGFARTDSGTYLLEGGLEGGETWSDEVVFGRARDSKTGNLHWKYSILR